MYILSIHIYIHINIYIPDRVRSFAPQPPPFSSPKSRVGPPWLALYISISIYLSLYIPDCVRSFEPQPPPFSSPKSRVGPPLLAWWPRWPWPPSIAWSLPSQRESAISSSWGPPRHRKGSHRRGRWHAPSSRHLRALLSVCGGCSFGGLGCCSFRVCLCVCRCRGCCSLSVCVGG